MSHGEGGSNGEKEQERNINYPYFLAQALHIKAKRYLEWEEWQRKRSEDH